ncbi:unnamed protein product [Cyclocybe aegerita]|uniref:Uncharacterized protein n=1 Tax=Cyclocybe aegerita TaxID=1973307 RepID=A0A8S0WCT7_CYCAE|nr:unnamed protein product [Cyclocybe aegerita]
MKISATFAALAFALATTVAAGPAKTVPVRPANTVGSGAAGTVVARSASTGISSLEVEALEARANDAECSYGNVTGKHCNDQQCKDGGGWCKYNAATKRCSMQNMRGSGSPVACHSCTCRKS